MKTPHLNEIQRRIYNMMVDNLLHGTKMILIIPRDMGKKTLREAVEKAKDDLKKYGLPK